MLSNSFFKPIDWLLDRITMYRLLLYVLILFLLIACGLSLAGQLQFKALGIVFSAGYLTVTCLAVNWIFSRIFEAPTGSESAYLTALILALIISPYQTPHDLIFLTAAGGLAMASKYILAINKKHIFNPAAVAVVLTAAGAGQAASWWVGTTPMLPFVFFGGFLIVRKIRRGQMVISFLLAVLVSTLVISLLTHHNAVVSVRETVLHSALVYFAFIMLTEPQTSPSTKTRQSWYGILVGLLFPPQVHILGVYSTPELSLVVGNVFAYLISPKVKLLPKLKRKVELAPDIADFIFVTKKPVRYKPGQYMEWTLPHSGTDSRGNRRYFTLASSPTENNIHLGVKFYPRGSSFKKAMFNMNQLTPIAAGQLGGDFVLPKDRSIKLAFIAGGIGITPYRSMMKYMIDSGDHRDVALVYSEKTAAELIYGDVFAEASRRFNAKLIYTLTNAESIPANWSGSRGSISAAMIAKAIPDYKDRLFYISGPYSLVTATKDMLAKLNVPSSRIKTDFFPGYA